MYSITFDSVYLGTYGLVVTGHDLPVSQQADYIQLLDLSYATGSKLPPKTISLQVSVTGTTASDLKTRLDNIKFALNKQSDKILQLDIYNDRYWQARVQSFIGAINSPTSFEGNLTFICYDPFAYGLVEISNDYAIDADPKTVIETPGGTATIKPIYTLTAGEELNDVEIKVENVDTGEEIIWQGSLASGWTVDSLAYTTRRKLTIDHTKFDAAQVDFAIPVKLTNANFDFAKANADGFDFRFTDSDGTTLLKYERERHDATNSLAEYWVKIPAISNTVDTIFYLYYRTTDTADGADPTNVWDANYKAVWHMNDATTSTILDSTSNDKDGIKLSANHPIEVDGKIAKGQDFEKDNGDYIHIAAVLGDWDTADTELTFECLIKVESYDISGDTLYNAACGDFYLRINSDGTVTFNVRQSDLTNKSITSVDSLYLATWYHIQASWKKNDFLNLSSNTVAETPVAVDDLYLRNTAMAYSAYIGLHGGAHYDGILDELRVSNVVRSAAYDKACYYAERDELLTYGSEDLLGGTLVIDTVRWVVEKEGVADMSTVSGQFPRLLPSVANSVKVTGFGILGSLNIKYRNRFV